jgi:hypothetical protein
LKLELEPELGLELGMGLKLGLGLELGLELGLGLVLRLGLHLDLRLWLKLGLRLRLRLRLRLERSQWGIVRCGCGCGGSTTIAARMRNITMFCLAVARQGGRVVGLEATLLRTDVPPFASVLVGMDFEAGL